MFHAERNWPVQVLVLDFMDFGDIAIPTLNQRVGSSIFSGPPYLSRACSVLSSHRKTTVQGPYKFGMRTASSDSYKKPHCYARLDPW